MENHVSLGKSRIMMASAMAIFGTIAIFVRNIGVSSAEIALYRALLAMLLLGGYFLVTGQKIRLSDIGKSLPLLLLRLYGRT